MKALDYQETALTMESAESSSEAEKKAADKLRQQQFMNAAARFNQSIHKQTNSSQETCNQTNSLKTISQNDHSQDLLSHSSIMQKTVSSCPPRPMLADITNNVEVNSNSVQKNSSGLLMQAKSYPAEDIYMPTENQAQLLNSDATDNAAAESSLMPSDNADANRNQHSVPNEKKKLKANPYQVLLGYVLEMKADMKEMKTTTNEIKQEVQNFKTLLNKNVTVTKEYIGTIKQICEKFNYKIPFQTVQQFQAFDADLKKNEDLSEAVTNVLQTGLDPTFVLSRSIVNMLKMYLSREVAAQYVAVKQKKNKHVMKPTNFFSLAEALIIERRSISNIKTTDKDMVTALSNVLSNAGSWYTSKKSEPSGSFESTQPQKKHARSSTSTSQDQEIIETQVVLTETEYVGTSDGSIRVLATEAVEPSSKYPRLHVEPDPLINGFSLSDDAEIDLIASTNVRFDALQDLEGTPSPEHTSEEEFDEAYYLGHFKNN